MSSMMLAGCSAALFVSPPRRPPLPRLPRSPKRPCLKATLATLLAGMLRPRALDRSELMVLVIAAWIWLLSLTTGMGLTLNWVLDLLHIANGTPASAHHGLHHLHVL